MDIWTLQMQNHFEQAYEKTATLETKLKWTLNKKARRITSVDITAQEDIVCVHRMC